PDHDLNLGYRQAIFWEFGPYRFAPRNTDLSGHLRRVNLAVITVEQVLPLWKKCWPDDPLPATVLKESLQVLNERPGKSTVLRKINRYWDQVENLMNETNNIVGAVGFAAIRTLSLALTDGFTTGLEIDFNRRDSHEFTSNNTEFYAAAAYAGGPVYSIRAAPESDANKREGFWQWWLGQAVPTAWSTVPIK